MASHTAALPVVPDPSRTAPSAAGPVDRLSRFFEEACDRTPSAVALECGSRRLTYAELDARANQAAHHLRRTGIGPRSRVALLLPRCVDMYVWLLGVCKSGAAFVPVDPTVPPERVAFILGDSGATVVVTTSALAQGAAGAGGRLICPVIRVDTCAGELSRLPVLRPSVPPASDQDHLAYVMYTSGSSGRPKGVEITRASACNFLRVVSPVYGIGPQDRVYQGMTISFDFSIEEIWPTWAAGAVLVAGPEGPARLLGAELAEFLQDHAVTALYCVPTLLATIPCDVPRLRRLVVGGEACPASLVERWSRPGRLMLNTYGPTETTVTATWQELLPGRPVTIGRPLQTYSVVLLDERLRPVRHGAVGEICLGGPGLARGYAGRPDLTADRFVEHPLAPGSGRLYRTGDLGRMTDDGEIEYLGRADAEVKIRGYRVSLEEIDNVLLEEPGVAQAATALVTLCDGGDGDRVLAAYVVPAECGTACRDGLVVRLHDRLRRSLPAYMVPSTLDFLDRLPVMPSGKVDRAELPVPTGRRLTGTRQVVPVSGEWEIRVRDAWAQVLGLDPKELSAQADFFTDLGGHSLLAARAVSLLRDRCAGCGPTLRDLYENPTVRAFAARLRDTQAAPDGRRERPRPEPLRHGRAEIARAGLAQATAFYLLLFALTAPVAWYYAMAHGPAPGTRIIGPGIAVLVGYVAVRWLLPLLLARPLTAGIRPGRYPLWGATYLRLWVLDVLLLGVSPVRVLSGSPLMGPYLRLLGARVGPRATVATSMIGVPALLSIGRDATIGYGVTLRPWQVCDGWVTVAPITVGEGACVGANAVLEPGARLGPGSALGEQSVVTADDAVPARARRAGSPARPVEALAPVMEEVLRTRTGADRWQRRQLAGVVVGLAALEASVFVMVVPSAALIWWAASHGTGPGLAASALSGPVFVLTVCLVVAVGKRAVLPRTPVGVHPARSALGVRKWISDKLLEQSLFFTNSLYATLYTVPWLRLLGARVGRRTEVSTAAHVDPDLLTLGEGSFVADMAGVGIATFAADRMAFAPTEVGDRAFVGNASLLPAGTRLGPGSLVGVGTLPPADGVPAGTTWLGSPALRLPVRQSSGDFPEERTFRPTRKAVVGRLAIEFFRATMPASVVATAALLYLLALTGIAARTGPLVTLLLSPLLAAGSVLSVIGYCVLAKWVVAGRYRPRVEPLWSLFVRRTEFVTGLFEAAALPAGVGALVGTPFLAPVLRLFGARIGRRTWIGTTHLTEFDLVEVGDDAAIGMHVSLQTHLFEDRVMKMSTVAVGCGASVGQRSIVLYDTQVGAGVRLGALSLVMKGERLTPGTSWHGLPAEGVAAPAAAPADGVSAKG